MIAKKDGAKFRDSKKQIILNIIANVLSYGISIVISFFLTPILIDKLGKEAYSFYPLSTTIITTMTIVTNALNSMASRFISISLHKNENKDANSYYASTIFADSILSLILFVLMFLFVIFVDKVLNVPVNLVAAVRMLFIFTFSSALVNVMSTVFGVATFAKNRIDLRSYREIGTSLLRLGLFVLFYTILPPSLFYIGLIALVISVVNIIVQYIYTKKLLPEVKFSPKNINKKHIKTLFVSSIWVTINSLGNTLLASVTLLMLNRFYGPAESSIVSISLTIPGFMGGIISVLVGVYFPIITKQFADNDMDKMRKTIEKVQLLVGGLGCAMIAVFSPISKSFFSLWVQSEDNIQLAWLSLINLLPYMFTSCFWVATAVNTAMNKIKVPAIVTLCIGVGNVLLQLLFGLLKINFISLPIICSVMQFGWVGIFMPIYLAKTTGVRFYYYYKPMLKILCLSSVVFGTTYALSEFIILNSWFKFLAFGAVVGLSSLVVYYLFLRPEFLTKKKLLGVKK